MEFNDQELDHLITYCESMLEMCDDEEELQFYTNLLNKLGGTDE